MNRMAAKSIAVEIDTQGSSGGDKKGKKKNKVKAQGCCNLDRIRTIVSTNKNRMVTENFNLDLTYITNRIIACGFPAEGFEALFRNKKEDLRRFFN